jgi:glutamate---cysteine ligase / carboxylate-amine ligase
MNEVTVGVEEEFFLVDDAGLLVMQAPEALKGTGSGDIDVKPELLRCQVESATGICRAGQDVFIELTTLRRWLASGAARRGARLAATATVVHEQPPEMVIGPGTRYHEIAQHFGELVFSGMTCGCHVHAGVAGKEEALKVQNHLRPWLPMLLAFSANSPYFHGKDTGYASARHVLYSRWPSAGPPPYLDSVDQYESIMSGMLDTSAALDRKMIYWDVRPSEHQPTVEVRVADVLGTVREATFLAILVRTIVGRSLDLLADGELAPRIPTQVIRAGLWRAARDGLGGHCPDPHTGNLRPVHRIIADLVKANNAQLKESGELDIIESTMDWLNRTGGGAHRQREAFANRRNLDDILKEVSQPLG